MYSQTNPWTRLQVLNCSSHCLFNCCGPLFSSMLANDYVASMDGSSSGSSGSSG